MWYTVQSTAENIFALNPDPKDIAGTQIYLAEINQFWASNSYHWS